MVFLRNVFIVSFVAIFCTLGCGNTAQEMVLPGSRPSIDAGEYLSLQAAFDTLPEMGGVVHIPAGHFKINEPLRVIRGEVTIMGAGVATHIENVNTDGAPAIILQHTSNENLAMEDRPWRIRIADLRITGNPQSGHGIEAQHIQELFLQGLTVSHNGGDGIHLFYCTEDARVSDCLITYNAKTGLYIEGNHDTIVSANQFEENHDAVRCIDGYNLTMTGNNIDDHLGNGVVLDNFYGSLITGNMIEQSNGIGIIMERGCYGVTVSGNILSFNQSGGVDLRSANSIAVSGNTMQSNLLFGCRIATEVSHVTVAANTFSNAFVTPDEFPRIADGGIVLDEPNDILIMGNSFVRPGHSSHVTANAARGVKVFQNNSVKLADLPAP
ncbi:right-handed parallel beta-helix repeat-containing protein [Candidatus Latescibacterota bacterium]